MAVNRYRCEECGDRDYEFRVGFPPTHCDYCGLPLMLLMSPNQFYIGGEDAWLTERAKDSIELQLGTRPESKEHLRQIEQAKGVTRLTKYDTVSAGGGDGGKPDPKPGWLGKAMQEKNSITVRGG